MKLKIHSPLHIDVIGDKGETHLVNLEYNTCSCMDFTYRGYREAGYRCRHIEFAIDTLYPS